MDKKLKLRKSERRELGALVRRPGTSAGLARRAKLILLSADGVGFNEIRDKLDCDVRFIQRWRERFAEDRVAGLVAMHRGRAAYKVDARLEARILDWTTKRKPADGSTHWSCRKLALELGGISHSTVQRVWSKHRIDPARLDRYMATNDPDFEAKAADIIYLHPPQHAAVFRVDEKTHIQALHRLDQCLPLSPGRAERHGFEYFRHGTLSLYATFNTRSGEMLGKTAKQHTSVEFVAFLSDIVANQPAGKEIHVIADNLSAHKTQAVRDFLSAHSNVSIHYTPTYSSWLNQVELWFAKIERDVIARGVFTSVADLARKLMCYLRLYNKNPKTVAWKYFDPTKHVPARDAK